MRRVRTLIQILFWLLLAVTLSARAMATTFFVSTTGQDLATRNGSSTQPWLTVAYAASRVSVAGDAIFVSAGTYQEKQQISLAPGVSLQGASQTGTILTINTDFFPTGAGSLILMASNPIRTEPSTISTLTIDGANKVLGQAVDALGRSNLTFHHLTVRNCKNWGINVQGGQTLRNRATIDQFVNGVRQTGAYLWPLTISGPSDLPPDADYVDNVKIYDSSFVNNTTTPVGQHWSYGPISFTGVRNLNISRIVIDETLSGGFGIKGTWAKNLKISRCDCRMKPRVAGSADGFAIEAWYVTGGDVFDNKSNGGISMGLQYDVRIHHNRIIVPAGGGLAGLGIEFGGYRSVADHNYFENTGGIAVGNADAVKIQHNVFRNTTGSIFVSTGDTPAGPSSARNIDIDNNSVDGNQSMYNEGAVSFRMMHDPAFATLSNIRIRNNIIVNSQPNGAWGGAISLNGQNGGCTYSTGISNVSINNNLFFQNLPADFYPNNCGVPTTQQANKFATNPLFAGGTTFPAPFYRLSATSPALAAGIFIGLPYNLAGPPDIGAYVQPAQGQRIEAEMAYSVAADVGTNSPVQMGDFTPASAGHAVTLYDVGDKARVHFNVYSAGNYRIFARVRSGSTNASTAYFQPMAYSYQLDGNPITLTADLTTISAFDSSGGGVYWGTMNSALIPLTAGPHSIEVNSSGAWSMLDYSSIQ